MPGGAGGYGVHLVRVRGVLRVVRVERAGVEEGGEIGGWVKGRRGGNREDGWRGGGDA